MGHNASVNKSLLINLLIILLLKVQQLLKYLISKSQVNDVLLTAQLKTMFQ